MRLTVRRIYFNMKGGTSGINIAYNVEIRQRPADPGVRMCQSTIRETQGRNVEIRQRPADPKGRMRQSTIQEKQKRNVEILQKPADPQGRMRQSTIQEKQKRHIEIRQRPAAPKRQQTAPPVYKQTVLGSRAEPARSDPQERMRQKARAEAQARHTGSGYVPASPRPEYQTPPAHGTDNITAFPDNQSINPIKERPRRSFVPKEKPAGGAFIPKTRQTAAASTSTARAAPTAAKGRAAARPLEQAKRRVQRNAQRKLLQQSTKKTKAAVDLSRRAAVATTKAVSSLISAIAGLLGGSFLIPVFCIVILVAAIIASPFGILFSNEPTPGAMPLNAAVGQLNMELSNSLEALQTGDYDSIDIQGHGPDWREVVAVFVAKTAGADTGVDVAALTPDRVDNLRAVFWDMCTLSSEVETIDHPAAGSTAAWTEKILHITITAKTADDMRTEYAFSEYQNKAVTELLAQLATMDILLTDLSVSGEQARELVRNLPADLAPERRAVVETACRLVGKVNYFWGGKSWVIGWDSRWGTIQKVWAAGSSTSGSYLPYGLDCSGFVDWVFYNISDGAYTIGHGGGARAQHTYCTTITWAEAQPGDLVFYPEDTHVGIVGGWDADGNILIIRRNQLCRTRSKCGAHGCTI